MIRGVLFDLDGTLIDTAPDLVAALNHVRHQEGLEPLPLDHLRAYASRGSLGLIGAGLPPGQSEVTEQRKRMFLEYYADNLYRDTRVFGGVEKLLEAMSRSALKWGIVTNKPEYLTLPLLKQAALPYPAGCVICGDTLTRSKPHPQPLLLACELLGIDPSESLMVGDDIRDIQAGKAAGIRTAFAAYGYLAPGDEHLVNSADWRIEHPVDLLDILEAAELGLPGS